MASPKPTRSLTIWITLNNHNRLLALAKLRGMQLREYIREVVECHLSAHTAPVVGVKPDFVLIRCPYCQRDQHVDANSYADIVRCSHCRKELGTPSFVTRKPSPTIVRPPEQRPHLPRGKELG